jgi:hypothetical protein
MPIFHVASQASAEGVCKLIVQAKAWPLMVKVGRPKRIRSLKANSRYWVLCTLIAEHVKPGGAFYDKERWHDYFVRRFLKPQEFTLPNGKVILEFPSTTDLPATAADADEGEDNFQDYATQVEVFANERGVVMPEFDA